MDILIPIETTSREILYKNYLCHQLALKGFNCYLGNKRNISFLLQKFENYVYIDKGYHKEVSDRLYKTIKQQKGFILSLDEEGGVDFPDNSTLINRYTDPLLKASELVFLWGEKQYQLINNLLKDSSNKLVITGHPRFELLKPAYRHFYEEEVNAIKMEHGNFILINTNIGFGNNIKGDDFVIENYGKRIKNIQEVVSFDKLKRDAFVELVRTIIKETNKSIVLRPHPEEDRQCYHHAFKGMERVKIRYEGSTIPWLLASEIMIHPDCTTAIESFFLGKKSISYLPSFLPSGLITKIPKEASIQFTKQKDVIDYLKNAEFMTKKPDLKTHSFIQEYFSFSKDSSQLIVDQICHLETQKINWTNQPVSVKDRLYLSYLSVRTNLSRSNSAKLSRNKLKGFDKARVFKDRNKFISRDKKFKEVKVKYITDKLFCFSRY